MEDVMLPESLTDVSVFLTQTVPAFFQSDDLFHPSTDAESIIQLILRWFHFVAGIIWIGHLYFFNLVNVNLMKALDAPTKGKVIPQLMPRALWWFRWGALITVLAGITYFAMYILRSDYRNTENLYGRVPRNIWVTFFVWLLIVVIIFGVEMLVMKRVNDGRVLGIIIGILVSLMAIAVIYWLYDSYAVGPNQNGASNRSYSIGIGGGLGVIMLFNVWGIIWPNQKRIISWTAENAETGTAIPPESAKLARVAFLASRTNTWLSVPMLLLMATSSHYIFMGK
jgi:uncharacterized membrane protein